MQLAPCSHAAKYIIGPWRPHQVHFGNLVGNFAIGPAKLKGALTKLKWGPEKLKGGIEKF